jgi:hypothetical protein
MDRLYIIDKVQKRVNKVCREVVSPTKLHWSLQKNMIDLAKELGYQGFAEKNCSDGRLDVIWTDGNGKELVAMEIDSSPRSRSVAKLDKRTAPIGIWIYYGTKLIEYDTSSFIVIRPEPESRRFKKGRRKRVRGVIISIKIIA